VPLKRVSHAPVRCGASKRKRKLQKLGRTAGRRGRFSESYLSGWAKITRAGSEAQPWGALGGKAKGGKGEKGERSNKKKRLIEGRKEAPRGTAVRQKEGRPLHPLGGGKKT